jgi:hypothetical protein
MKFLFDKGWFRERQRILLWLLNAPLIKIWFRYVLRIRKFDCPIKTKITSIAPNNFSFGDRVILKDGKLIRERTTDFRTHNKFSKRLYFAFLPIWYLCHAWDIFIANNFKPAWNLGFDTLTVYPDASSGATTVDGYINRIGVDQTWADIIAGSGTNVLVTGDLVVRITASGTTNQWAELYRNILTFDTSALTADATISAAVLSIYGWSKLDNLSITPDCDIYTATPAANNNLATSDYGQIGTTSQTGSPITYAGWDDAGYNAFTFNATGRGNVSKTGISKFGWRNANYDVAASPPAWTSVAVSRLSGRSVDTGGAGEDPKLVITYTTSHAYTKELTQSLKVMPVLSRQTQKTLSQILKVIPAITRSMTRTLSQFLRVVPTYARVATRLRTYTQALKVFGAKTISMSRTLSQFVRIVPSIKRDISRAITAVIKVVSSKIYSFGRTISSPVKLASSIIFSTSRTLSEVIKVISTSIKDTTRVLGEIISVVDQSINTIFVKIFSEVVVIYHAIEFQTSRTLSEVIKVSGALASFVVDKVLIESVAILSSIFFATTRTLLEAIIVVSEVFSDISRALRETIKVSSLSAFFQIKGLCEQLIIIPAYTRVKNVHRTYSEIVNVLDVRAFQPIKVFTQRIVVAPIAATFQTAKTFVDRIILSDTLSFIHGFYHELSEAFSVASQMTLKGIKIFVEVVKISFSFVLQTAREFSEVIVAGANALTQWGVVKYESLVAASSFVIDTISKLLIETVKIVGQTLKTLPSVAYAEVLAVSDAFLRSIGKLLIEVLNIIEATATKAATRIFTEVLRVFGANSFIHGFYKTLTDSLKLDYAEMKFTERRPTGLNENKNWYACATSSDGSKLIVSFSSGRIYTSSDYGVSWTERRPTGVSENKVWNGVASDYTGQYLLVCAFNGRVYRSINYGVDWTETQPKGNFNNTWYNAAVSGDGKYMLVSSFNVGGRLYTSSDYGVSWTERRPEGDVDKMWDCLSADADGSFMVAAIYNGKIYKSENYGVDWIEILATGPWYGIAIDTNGSNLIASAYGSRLWTSADYGVSWTERRPTGEDANKNWYPVASDFDGSHLLAGISGSSGVGRRLYFSRNYGVDWIEIRPAGDVDVKWQATALNGDGSRMLVIVSGGRVYVSDISHFFATATKNLIENIIAAATFTLTIPAKIFYETVAVVSEFLKEWTLSRVYEEVLSVISSTWTETTRIFTEVLNVVGSFVLGTISKLLTETIKIYETLTRVLPSKVYEEVVRVFDKIENQAARILNEVIVVGTEFILGTISKVLVESIKTIQGFLTGGVFYKELSEVISVVGNVLNQGVKIFTETLNIIGTFVLGTISKLLKETIKISSATTRAITRTISAVLKVGGNVYKAPTRVFTLVIRVVPTMLRTSGKLLLENIVIGWAKIKLVLNGTAVGLWKKIARVTNGVWKKISRND